MLEDNRMWLAQNLLWLKFLVAAICLGVLLALFIVKTAPDIVSFALQMADSDRPTLAELQVQVSSERSRGRELLTALDSVRANARYSEQAVLASVQTRCQLRKITIIGYDRVTAERTGGSSIPAYRFSVEGRFYEVTMLLADLESQSPRMTASSVSFESKLLGQDKIRGVFVLHVGA